MIGSVASLRPEPTLWQALVLGFIQGVTEFLPISSTAHLRIVPALLQWPDFGASFSAVIQLGSVGAVLIYFWSDLVQVGRGSWQAVQKRQFQAEAFKTLVGILLGTLPIVVTGFGIKVFLREPPRSLGVIAGALIGLALLLAWAERAGRRTRTLKDIDVWDGILVGAAQALALIPGVSRSGSTLTAALFLGFERTPAARFSFLLGIPALVLAGVVEFATEIRFTPETLGSVVAGTLSAFVFSYLAIDWLLRYFQRHSTRIFIYYRIGLGVLLLVLWQAGLVQ